MGGGRRGWKRLVGRIDLTPTGRGIGNSETVLGELATAKTGAHLRCFTLLQQRHYLESSISLDYCTAINQYLPGQRQPQAASMTQY